MNHHFYKLKKKKTIQVSHGVKILKNIIISSLTSVDLSYFTSASSCAALPSKNKSWPKIALGKRKRLKKLIYKILKYFKNNIWFDANVSYFGYR